VPYGFIFFVLLAYPSSSIFILFCIFLPLLSNIKLRKVYVRMFQVNGDTLFMTSNFKEFKVENHENSTWDENNALTSTAVCILF